MTTPSPPSALDSRQLSRVPCQIVVSSTDRSASIGEIRNLSLDGLYIATGQPLPQGSVLNIAFCVGADELTAEVEVVRRAAQGMGLRFLSLSSKHSRLLRRYVTELASLVGHRDTVAKLHDVESRTVVPIRGEEEIKRLLSESAAERVAHTIIPAERSVRASAKIESLEADHLVLRLDGPVDFRPGENVFVLHTLDFVSYSFGSRVLECRRGILHLALPELIHYSERRSSQRTGSEPGAFLSMKLPGPEGGTPVQWSVIETSPGGLSFRAEASDLFFLPGTPLVGATIVFDEAETPLDHAVVKHVTHVREPGVRGWLKVGVAHGIRRSEATVERESVAPQPSRGALGRIARWGRGLAVKASYLYHRSFNSSRDAGGGTAFQVVRFPNRAGKEVVGLLNRAFDSDEQVRGPLVIVVPAYGGRKEALSALALTIVHNFRRHHRDIAVLRIDDVNNLGESYKDPGCTKDGLHALHYTVSGVIDDVIGSLSWGKNNRFIDPTDVIVVSTSFSSIGVRRALTMPEAADVTAWVAFMGAADAQNAVLHVSGNIDIYGNYVRGVPNGVVSLVGCMNDADHFCRDAHALKVATLEDARRDMSQVRANVVWIVGKHDAWMDSRRVHDVMSVEAQGAREVVEVDAGHVPRSSEEAIAEFMLVTRRIWRHLYGSDLDAVAPPAGWVGALSKSEWDRVRRAPPENPTNYWREYLLGKGGFGFDVLQFSPAYMEFIAVEARLASVAGKRVLDLGAGTGNLTVALLRDGPLEIVALDLVPEALERLRAKIPSGAPVRTVHADAEGGPLVVMRRWVNGELQGLEELAGRIPGVNERDTDAISKKCSPQLHAILRGASLDIGRELRQVGLSPAYESLLSDLRTLARVARKEVDPAIAKASLHRMQSDVLEIQTGLPFPDSRFDVVVSSLVLSYMNHPLDTLSEVRRVLVPGGRLILSSMKRDADSSKLFIDLLSWLESAPVDALPSNHQRAELVDAARTLVNSASDLMRLEEEGVFRFFDASELEDLLLEAGFIEVSVVPSYGTPPQAVIAVCRRP